VQSYLQSIQINHPRGLKISSSRIRKTTIPSAPAKQDAQSPDGISLYMAKTVGICVKKLSRWGKTASTVFIKRRKPPPGLENSRTPTSPARGFF
jgi:hypothetical protein